MLYRRKKKYISNRKQSLPKWFCVVVIEIGECDFARVVSEFRHDGKTVVYAQFEFQFIGVMYVNFNA